MRTYDPADRIRYVHVSAGPAAPEHPHDECHRLPASYANASLRGRLGQPRAAGTRAPLVLLPGGAAPADVPAPTLTPPALRRAR